MVSKKVKMLNECPDLQDKLNQMIVEEFDKGYQLEQMFAIHTDGKDFDCENYFVLVFVNIDWSDN